MKIEYFMNSIGKQADSDVVVGLLRALGIERRITIRRDDMDVYMNNTDAGVSLLFESESYVSAKYHVGFPSDAPVLTAIFLYGPGDDESQYTKEIFQGDCCSRITGTRQLRSSVNRQNSIRTGILNFGSCPEIPGFLLGTRRAEDRLKESNLEFYGDERRRDCSGVRKFCRS